MWTNNVPSSEKSLSSWANGCSTSTKVITNTTSAGTNRLMGGFWANVAKTSTNSNRSSLDQARMALLQQVLAAILNKYTLGTSDGGLIATAKSAYCGTNVTAITSSTDALGTFNQSGDTVSLNFPNQAADPGGAKLQANIPYWNTTK